MVREDMFTVRSQSGPGAYRVSLGGKHPECNCPDYVKRNRGCKHIASVRFYLEKQTVLPSGEVKSERIPITYSQAWEAYDKGQTEEIRLFDVLLRDLVSEVPTPERDPHRAGRPPIPVSEELFCAVQKVYSQLSCRRSNSLFGFAVERGQLSKRRHYTISSEVMSRGDVTPILEHLITRSAIPLASLEHGFAPDSTGIRTTSFGAWMKEKHGDTRQHLWLKAHAFVGTKTHIVVRASVTGKDGSDYQQFEQLVRGAIESGFQVGEVFADKAYTGRSNYLLAETLGFDFYAPFRSNDTPKPTVRSGNTARDAEGRPISSRLWTKTFHFFQLHREEFEAKFHQRSNVESVFSAIKRKFGETLRSRNPTAQANELLAKILAYNLTVVIHEIFEHGIVPDFLSAPRPPVGESGPL